MKKLQKLTDKQLNYQNINYVEIAFKNSEKAINDLRQYLHTEINFICIEYGDELYSLAIPYATLMQYLQNTEEIGYENE